jgi:hypothetical protein
MTLTGIVVAGTLRALSAQKKFYARQARILAARHAMRATATILSAELRETSSSGGDVYTIGVDSLAIRSTVGFGVACAVNVGAGTLALTVTSGHFRLETADSILVYVENGLTDADDTWTALPVFGISPTGPSCAWGNSADLQLTVGGSLAGTWVGAPVRFFRPYAYGIFEMNGTYWLGRRNRASAIYVPVAGPLAPPSQGGLELTYYDYQTRLPTLDPGRIGRVDVTVRSPTYRSLSDPDYKEMSTSVYLRN